jgi:thiol-disulfide isomerase/thioredoxin
MALRWNRVEIAAVGLALFAVAASMPLGATRAQTGPAPYACSPEAKPANLAFTLKDLGNADVALSAFKGKVLLVNFWATWCGPCKIETPWFIDLQDRYGAKGLQVLGVSIDDPLSLLKPYAADHKINYPVLQALGHREVVSAFGPLRGVPTTYIISRDGKLCAKHIGVTPREGFESQVAGLLSAR